MDDLYVKLGYILEIPPYIVEKFIEKNRISLDRRQNEVKAILIFNGDTLDDVLSKLNTSGTAHFVYKNNSCYIEYYGTELDDVYVTRYAFYLIKKGIINASNQGSTPSDT